MEHFRGPADINHYLVRYWQLCEGNFYPRKTRGKMCLVNMDNYQEYAEGIRQQKWQMVSLNEDCTPEEFEVIKKLMGLWSSCFQRNRLLSGRSRRRDAL